MATIEMNLDNFDSTIEGNDIVLIDFWAEWCGPCKSFAPVFTAASEKHADVAFAKVDTDTHQELAGQFGIRSIPTIAAFREKVMVFMQPGALPESALEELIVQIKALDMDDVRAKVAEAEKKAANDS
ncbi:MAG: thioredoxin [Rhodospirillaceae bacterium]|nr:thioredoxin [Rhodospirillaceae bacterium]